MQAHNCSTLQRHSLGLTQGGLQNHGSLRSLRCTKVETFWLGGFIEDGGTVLLQSWARDLGAAICALTLWRIMENLQGKKATLTTSIHWLYPLTRGGATPLRQRHLRSNTEFPLPEDWLEEQVNEKLYGYHNTVKLQRHGKIVYWTPGFPHDPFTFRIKFFISFSLFLSLPFLLVLTTFLNLPTSIFVFVCFVFVFGVHKWGGLFFEVEECLLPSVLVLVLILFWLCFLLFFIMFS